MASDSAPARDSRIARRLLDEHGATFAAEAGIGPTGANIFLREVQAVWPSVAPFADDLVLQGAKAANLPADAEKLVGEDEFAGLASALVLVARDPELVESQDPAEGR